MPRTGPAYARPDGDPVRLTERPRLASWDAAGLPSQQALTRYLDAVETDLGPSLSRPPPWAIDLQVGLPTHVPLLDQHDLDNYLLPLATRLGGTCLCSARAAKRHSSESWLRLDSAQPRPDVRGLAVRTTASAGSAAYKQQIHDQLVALRAQAAPHDAGLTATISFRTGAGRNWINLWKPTIDALGPLLGEGPRPWHPRDGAIVDLTLHHDIDAALRWDVEIVIDVHVALPDTTT